MHDEKSTTNRKKLLWLTLLLLLFIGGIAVYHFSTQKEIPVSIISGDFLPEGKDAQKISEAEMAKYAQTAVDASNFNMIISSEATINKKTDTGDLLIQNPPHNAYPVNVEIHLDETDELIYTSGAILPGEEIQQVFLEKKLKQGVHKATATFSLYDSETKEKKGQVASGVTLMVN
jgi:hypothetical protein